MMLFGYCVNMIAKDPYGVGYEWLEVLKEVGFDYVELPLAQLSALDPAFLSKTVVHRLKASGLPCLRMNNFFPASYRLTGPEADHVSALEYARRALGLAAECGAETVVFGSSGAKNAPDGFPLQTAFQQVADFLIQLSPIARQQGVTVAIEPLNRMESNLINHFSEGLTLARMVGQPQVGVLVDYYHMRVSFETMKNLLNSEDLLKHVHIARPLGRILPSPDDQEPYDCFFNTLRAIRYDGTVSIEAYEAEANPKAKWETALAYLKKQSVSPRPRESV